LLNKVSRGDIHRRVLVAMPFRAWLLIAAIGLTWAQSARAIEDIDELEIQPESAEAETADKAADIPPPERPAIPAPTKPPSDEHQQDSPAYSDGDSAELPDIFLGDGWAQWAMALLALLGVLISGWAVWLLKRTLDATQAAIGEAEKATIAAQQATAVTREIGQAQTRAYIVFSGVGFSIPEDADWKNPRKLHFEAQWDITGHSPAIDVYFQMEAQYLVGKTPQDFLREVNKKEKSRSYGAEKSRKIGSIVVDLDALERRISNGENLWILARVEYGDIFGDGFFYSERMSIIPTLQPARIYIRDGKPAGFGINSEGIWGEVKKGRTEKVQ
jgi:hypothetical protein